MKNVETATISFKQDASKSIQAFNRFGVPVMKAALGAKKIISTEHHKNEIEKFLDQEAGIDALAVVKNGTVYPVACRLQFDKRYDSFSLRRSRPNDKTTEHAKLAEAFRTGGLMPKYHLQGFVETTRQTAIVAVTETVDLIKYVDKHPDQWRKNNKDNVTFYYCPWRELDKVKVYLVDEKGNVKRTI